MSFESKLKSKYNINPETYMKIARERADKLGHTGELKFVDDGIHKMEYDGIKFGNQCCKDFIIYTLTQPEKAEMKKRAYHSRMFAASADRPITRKMKLTKIIW